MKLSRRLGVGLWAAVGVVVGHELAYRLVYGSGQGLHHALEDSGHGWLELVRPAAVLFFAGAVGASVVAGRQRAASSPLRFSSRFAMLAGAQATTFLGLEIAERAAHGYSLAEWHHDLVEHRGLWLLAVGVAVQLVVAAVAALLSFGVELFAAAKGSPAPSQRAAWVAPSPRDVPRRRIRNRPPGRGPPAVVRIFWELVPT